MSDTSSEMGTQQRYMLRIKALGKHPEKELDQESFESIKRAKEVLIRGFAMEEQYEILISNYLEFEQELLKYTAESMVRNNLGYDSAFQMKMDLNRRLINIFTAAKSYIDRIGSHVKRILPEAFEESDFVGEYLSKKYDELFEYKFLEALRNHVQHWGLPIHLLQIKPHWDDSERSSDVGLAFVVEVVAKKEELEQNAKFKRTVLAEMPEQVDLKGAVRAYIEAISDVHESLRDRVSNVLAEAHELLESSSDWYSEGKSKPVGLYAILEEDGRYKENISMSTDWDDVRIKLVERNLRLVNLSRRYVTSKKTLEAK